MMDIEAPYKGIVEHHTCDLQLDCDAVVVGSGPTGAVAAANLIDKGLKVIMLEAGPVRRPTEFVTDAGQTLAEAAWDGGVRAMIGKPMMPTIQARVLGGGSLINSAMSLRAPDFVFEDWQENWGLKTITSESMAPHYQRVEDYLGIRPTEEKAWGQKNILFKKACDALGYESEPTPRNVIDCCGCAECFTGCPTRSKKSTDITYIPDAIAKGMKVYTSAMVHKVHHLGGAVTGVSGKLLDPKTGKSKYSFSIRTPRVIMAAGCLATPVILQKSGVEDPNKMIGKDLQCHPGVALMGLFEHEVNPWVGATQGYQSREFLKQGFKMEVLWAPPAVLAVRLPGFGKDFKNSLANYKHAAIWDAIVSCKHSFGRVRARRGKSMSPVAHFQVDDRDLPMLKEAAAVLADMFVAAEAHTVLTGIHGMPDRMKAEKGLGDKIRAFPLKQTDLVLASTHLFSSTRMGPNAHNSVVNESGQVHNLKGCYIVDTGVLPRSPSVNPMLTGMAFADRISLGIN